MWFKTRLGLTSVVEPFEIRVAAYSAEEASYPYYLIYARNVNDVDVKYKGILGNLTAPSRLVQLARFEYADASEPEIAQCMKLIGEAIANESRVCDLGSAGHVDAWLKQSSDWFLVKW